MQGRPFWREHREIPVGTGTELDRLKHGAAEPADAWIEAEGVQEEGSRPLAVAWREILSNRETLCLLAYERGMSFREIAEVLGVSRATVQSYVERARAKLERVQHVQLALWDESPELGT
ncbi:MAG: LuxR C-terminal-related transcriptional regulator [Alicyclobacillus sp.]|nr:LuxR C-terminal-related transcriptional regulator [Alicyclobacillus sp.]